MLLLLIAMPPRFRSSMSIALVRCAMEATVGNPEILAQMASPFTLVASENRGNIRKSTLPKYLCWLLTRDAVSNPLQPMRHRVQICGEQTLARHLSSPPSTTCTYQPQQTIMLLRTR
jgi:hypothetical protein